MKTREEKYDKGFSEFKTKIGIAVGFEIIILLVVYLLSCGKKVKNERKIIEWVCSYWFYIYKIEFEMNGIEYTCQSFEEKWIWKIINSERCQKDCLLFRKNERNNM